MDSIHNLFYKEIINCPSIWQLTEAKARASEESPPDDVRGAYIIHLKLKVKELDQKRYRRFEAECTAIINKYLEEMEAEESAKPQEPGPRPGPSTGVEVVYLHQCILFQKC